MLACGLAIPPTPGRPQRSGSGRRTRKPRSFVAPSVKGLRAAVPGRIRRACPGVGGLWGVPLRSFRGLRSVVWGCVVAVVAFAGSRSVVPAVVAPAVRAVQASGRSVVVGCAPGVDAAVAAAAPGAVVLSASSSAPWALAARTRLVVAAAVAGGPGSALVAFPSGPCPVGCVPGASVSGSGSGTWLAVALAVSSSLPVVVFLSSGVSAPAWPGGSWVVAGVGVWSGAVRWAPGAVQASLF